MIKIKESKLLVRVIKQNWLLVILALFLAIVASVLEGLSATLVMPLLSSLDESKSNTSGLKVPQFLDPIKHFYDQFSDQNQLIIVIVVFFVVILSKNIFLYSSIVQINNLKLKTGLFLRQKCIDRFLKLELTFYNQSQIGKLLSYVNEHVQHSEILTAAILQIIRNSITIIVLMYVLFTLSPTLTFIAFVILLIVSQVLKPIINLVRRRGRRAALSIENFSGLVTELINGIRIIQGFNVEKKELYRAKQCLQHRYNAEFSALKYSSLVSPLTETIGIGVLLLLLALGSGLLISSIQINFSLLLTYMFALLRLIPRITHLNSLRSQISLHSGSLDSINLFLNSTNQMSITRGNILYKRLRSCITFDNVTFTFPGNLEPSLKGINFSIPYGKMTALVGSSGSGKSTIADLIMRFYQPNFGVVKADNIDLQKLEISSWRQSIAMVNQDTFLFHASIKDNISYGYSQATEIEIIEAAKKAYAYDFIQELPNGFDTIVGNRGTKLSGGQRQRIAIARAILCNPDILILDEATSALDTHSERIVQKAIEKVSQNRTVIVIAHRLSTINKADTIVVLGNGEVLEQGNHQQLIANRGDYYALYQTQSQKALTC